MANQYKNKVIYGNQTLMDITDTTATENDVLEGEVFYSASGARSVGTLGDATQSTHGLMSATDKVKLDGITLLGVKLNSNALTPDANGYVNIPLMTGATSSTNGTAGLIPAPTSADAEKFFRGDGTWQDGGRPMVILSYGNSTWNDFIEAYNNHVIVYCRASSNSNPKTGSQTRMAFMAYVNNAATPTEVEFQYYRSMSSHSATQMGDQVYVYKLTNKNAWTVTIREASVKQVNVSGNGLTASWSNNQVTLSNTMTANDMPMSSNDITTVKSVLDKSFQRGGISNPTALDDNTLIGTFFARDTACTGLPTSNTGDYYSIVALGMYQIAARYSSSGAKETYARYYINDQWYGWKSYTNTGGWLASGTNIDTIIIAGTYGIDGTASYTGLPSGVTWGILEVLTPTIGGTYGIQVIHQGRMQYERYRSINNGTEWGAWYSFTGTAMS